MAAGGRVPSCVEKPGEQTDRTDRHTESEAGGGRGHVGRGPGRLATTLPCSVTPGFLGRVRAVRGLGAQGTGLGLLHLLLRPRTSS